RRMGTIPLHEAIENVRHLEGTELEAVDRRSRDAEHGGSCLCHLRNSTAESAKRCCATGQHQRVAARDRTIVRHVLISSLVICVPLSAEHPKATRGGTAAMAAVEA